MSADTKTIITSDIASAKIALSAETGESLRVFFERLQFAGDKLHRAVSDFVEDFDSRRESFRQKVTLFANQIETGIDRFFEHPSVRPLLERDLYQNLVKTQWVPHRSMPVSEVKVRSGKSQTDAILLDHYQTHWRSVSSQIRYRYRGKTAFSTSIDVLNSALSLHTVGQYRAVCRLILPEFERLYKAETGLGPSDEPSLKTELSNLALEIIGKNAKNECFAKLVRDHIYSRVKTEQQLAPFIGNEIPNRHACIHGLIDYNSKKASLNCIFLLDIVLEIFDTLHANRDQRLIAYMDSGTA